MANERNPNIAQQQPGTAFVSAPETTVGAEYAKGLTQIGQTLIQQRQQAISTELQEELMQAQREALGEAERMARPTGSSQELGPGQAKTLQDFQRQMDSLEAASQQGTRSMTNLKIRQERILREYMARYPMLTDQFNAAATGVLGYSPLGAEVRAADEAVRAAGRSGMGAVTSFYLQRAEDLKIDTTLYLTDPERFWGELQERSARRGAIEKMALENQFAKEAGLHWDYIRGPQFDVGVSALAVDFWQQPAGVMDTINTALAAVGFDPESPGAEQLRAGQQNIRDVLGTGAYERFRVEIRRQKEEALDVMWREFAATEGEAVNSPLYGRSKTTPLTRAQFAERVKPILDLYDYAAEFAGNDYAMKTMESLLKAREMGIVATLPDAVLWAREIVKMIPPDTTLGQMLMRGEMGDTFSTMLHRLMVSQFPNEFPQVPGPVQPPTVVEPGKPNPTGNTTGSALPTPQELGLSSPEDISAADEDYQRIITDVAQVWIEAGVRDGDRALAAYGLNALAEYGAMTNRARDSAGPRPSFETDMAFIEAVASDAFPAAFKLAYNKPVSAVRDIEPMIGVVANVGYARAQDEIMRVSQAIQQPRNFDQLRAIDDRAGRMGVSNNRPRPSADWVDAMFKDYVTVTVTPESTVVYGVAPSTPQAFKEYANFVVELMNQREGSTENRTLALVGRALSNLTGYTPSQALQVYLVGGE